MRLITWLFNNRSEARRRREIKNVYLFMARANRRYRMRNDEVCRDDECVARVREAGQ
jgi:hypothetical protein